MADEVDQFIAALYQRAKQDGEDPHDVADRIYQNARGVSRRELLQGGAGVGVGALLGSGGMMAATGQASASDHTDSDGNVGLPGDRVDLFADSADANSLNSDNIDSKVSNGTVIGNHPDFAEVQDAVVYADNNGHNVVYLPAGTYPVTASSGASAVTVRSNISLVGAGENKTTIKLEDSQPTDYSTVVRLNAEAELRNLTVDGNRANQSDGGSQTDQSGVSSPLNSQTPNTVIENVTVVNTVYRGFFLTGMPEGRFDGLHAEGCGERGVHVEDRTTSAPSTGITASDLRAINCGADTSLTASPATYDGIAIGDEIDDSEFSGLVSKGPSDTGIWVEACGSVEISGVSEGAGGIGVRVVNSENITANFVSRDAGTDGAYLGNNAMGDINLTVQNATNDGVHVDGNIRTADITVEVAGHNGVRFTGCSRGRADISVVSANGNSSGYEAFTTEDDGSGNSCRRLTITANTVASNGATLDANSSNIYVDGFVDGGVTDNGTGNDTSNVIS